MNQIHDPLTFVDTIGVGKHVVLFYQEPEYGKKIQFRFIKNGLLKGEHCVYVTAEEDITVIESAMEKEGIDVENFKKNGLLHIYKVQIPTDAQEIPVAIEKICRQVKAEVKTPFRLVDSIIEKGFSELSIEQLSKYALAEELLHRNFDPSQGCVLCGYSVENIKARVHSSWVAELLKNHHAAIFATTMDKGIGFNMR